MNKEIEIPNGAGQSPASDNEPQKWRPVIEIPNAPQEIKAPENLTRNSSGCYPNQMPN
jgi:hypothetical protein